MRFTLSIGFCDVSHYLPLARVADAAGWDAVCVPDGLFYYEQCSPYPYSETGERFWSPQTPFLDPFAVVSAMGAATQRVQFYSNVLKLAVRDPLLVAKAATSASVLTGGRFALGVGLSPWREDFDVLGETWENRGPRSGEMVEIIRGLSRGGMFEYRGKYYTVPRMEIAPVPATPLPIYFGGLADAVLKRAARLGDGWIWWENPKSTLAQFPTLVTQLAGHLAAAQRPEAPALGQGFELKAFPSSVGIDVLEKLASLGVTDLIVMPWLYYPGDPMDLGFRLDAARRFADEVIPRFRR